jgi:hypothetical protein
MAYVPVVPSVRPSDARPPQRDLPSTCPEVLDEPRAAARHRRNPCKSGVREWSHRDSNTGPLACEASALTN